jgi:hypothetical protein
MLARCRLQHGSLRGAEVSVPTPAEFSKPRRRVVLLVKRLSRVGTPVPAQGRGVIVTAPQDADPQARLPAPPPSPPANPAGEPEIASTQDPRLTSDRTGELAYLVIQVPTEKPENETPAPNMNIPGLLAFIFDKRDRTANCALLILVMAIALALLCGGLILAADTRLFAEIGLSSAKVQLPAAIGLSGAGVTVVALVKAIRRRFKHPRPSGEPDQSSKSDR